MGMYLDGPDLHFNWTGWRWLISKLIEWDVDVSEFRFTNDREPISDTTCIAVAQAIEDHMHELNEQDRDWLIPQIGKWRNCGGTQQW